jgi:ribosome-binding factor A
MESNRQKKIAGILQEDLAQILQGAASSGDFKGTLISVTQVKVTVDLSIAKVYLSIFPTNNAAELLKDIKNNTPAIRHEVAQRTRHQLRRMPQLEFFIDDSLQYIEEIDRSLKGSDNPIENPNLLDKRKKS